METIEEVEKVTHLYLKCPVCRNNVISIYADMCEECEKSNG